MADVPKSDAQARKIAAALETLVADGVCHIEASMIVLQLPPALRGALWREVCHRAMAKVIACEGASQP